MGHLNFFAISWSNSQCLGLENISNLIKYPFLEIKKLQLGKIINGQNLHKGEKGRVQMPCKCLSPSLFKHLYLHYHMLSLEQALGSAHFPALPPECLGELARRLYHVLWFVWLSFWGYGYVKAVVQNFWFVSIFGHASVACFVVMWVHSRHSHNDLKRWHSKPQVHVSCI